MKKSLIKIVALSAVFVLGAGLSINASSTPTTVFAIQHEDNYQEYKYSGTYYSTIGASLTDGLNGTLRKSLSSLILPKGWYTYSGSSDGTLGKVLQSADEDPTNSANMVMFYTRDSVSKRGAGNGSGQWNREHVWPRSLSNDNWSSKNGGSSHAGTDILHVRPTWYDANETRGSTKYGDNNKTGVQKYSGMEFAYTSGSYFEPLDSVKGDVARILMYVWTAYVDYYNDSGLVVTKAIQSYDVLLKWHTMDKPDALEGHRNDFSEDSKQKNRNPFVDHPEYAWKIFGDSASSTVKNDCMAAYPDNNSGQPPISSSSSIGSSTSSSVSSESSSSSISVSSSDSSSSISSSESSSSSISSSEISSSSIANSESSSTISSSSEAPSSSEISSSEISSSSAISSEEPSSSEIISSSEEPSSSVITSEQPSSEPISSSSSNQPSEPKKSTGGCHSSLIGTISLTSLVALFGLVFALSKKK